MDPRGTVGSIYKGEYYTLVHTTYEALDHMVSEKIFFMFFACRPWGKPVWTPGAWLAGFIAGFIKRTIIHCYTQNMKKALGLVVSEKKIF